MHAFFFSARFASLYLSHALHQPSLSSSSFFLLLLLWPKGLKCWILGLKGWVLDFEFGFESFDFVVVIGLILACGLGWFDKCGFELILWVSVVSIVANRSLVVMWVWVWKVGFDLYHVWWLWLVRLWWVVLV